MAGPDDFPPDPRRDDEPRDDVARADPARHVDADADSDTGRREEREQREFPRVVRDGDPDGHDHFAPPREPCECYCLHCNRTFMSSRIWFQRVVGQKGKSSFDGFWMCPTPNCSGAGFTFDIFPTDPAHPANDGWYSDDGDEDDDQGFPGDDWDEDELLALDAEPSDDGDDDFGGEWDPAEPKYALLDQQLGDGADDIIEGDEWKLGPYLGPYDDNAPRPPLGWSAQARREWEEEQRRYDEPDRRPRELDWSDRPEEEHVNDDDMPF